MFIVPNQMVALEPFPVSAQTVEVKRGVIAPMNQSTLTRLKIVFLPDESMKTWPDDYGYTYAWVRSRHQNGSTWGKDVMEVNQTKFILVPLSEIVLWERT